MIDPDDIPPTLKGRNFELKAEGLREFAGLRSDEQRLDPFTLAGYAGLMVFKMEDIAHLMSKESLEQLTGAGKDQWSGGAASQKLPNGKQLIILNPTHGKNRHNATLMEEIAHVFLGHKPSRLAIEKSNSDGTKQARDYHPEIEEEAYGTGAAALVPYSSLKRYVLAGKTAGEIAGHFGVSRGLVEYRIKVSRLWDVYKENVFRTQ